MLLIEIEKLWNIDGQMLTLVVDFLGDVLNTTSKSLSPNRVQSFTSGYFHNFLNPLLFMLSTETQALIWSNALLASCLSNPWRDKANKEVADSILKATLNKFKDA